VVYDCFTFFNELDLLDLRLNVLNDVVDKFVIVEATKTQQGNPKELFFNNNKHLFSKFIDKIIHVIVTDMPEPNGWNIENFQRNCILRGLTSAQPDDRILISDVDEIPNPIAVKNNIDSDRHIAFKTKLYYYYVNCLQNQMWMGPAMITKKYMRNPQMVRDMVRTNHPTYIVPVEEGWHFSYVGGLDRVITKINSIIEGTEVKPEQRDPSHLLNCITKGKDHLNREQAFAQKKFVYIDESYPAYMNEWISKFPYMVKERT